MTKMADRGREERDSTETTLKSRKRKHYPEKWKRNVSKRSKALGLAYERNNGSKVSARKTGKPCRCHRCFSVLTISEKRKILDDFNQLGDKNLQDSHIFGLVERKPVKRHRIRCGTGKARTISYVFKVRIVNYLSLSFFVL